jgi:hypothetical protein
VTRLAVRCFQVVALAAMVIGLAEWQYRRQLIDAYAPELARYNDHADIESRAGRSTVLVMGDSFTAGSDSYPSLLRHGLPGHRVINAGVPGTGPRQMLWVAPRRFAQFHPDIFIYQVYVGKDLFDIRYSVNWSDVSLARNLYWTLANRLGFLVYLNYRLAQYRGNAASPEIGINAPGPFSVQRYTRRPAIYLAADPTLIEDQVGVLRGRRRDFEVFGHTLDALTRLCAPEVCRAYLLVIPHCAQVSARYLSHTEAIGGVFNHRGLMVEVEYPFVRETRERLRRVPNATVLNPIEALRRAENEGRPVYYENDDHLNASGQAEIARVLLAALATSAAENVKATSSTQDTAESTSVRP